MTTHDTIARLVDAYTDSLGAVVSHAVRYSAAQSNEERGHVQRDMHAALEESRQHLHQAFLETLGPGAKCVSPAPAAEGPWVVRVLVRGSVRWHSRSGPAESFLHDASTYETRAEAEAAACDWGAEHLPHVLTLAEAERAESFRSLADRAGPPPVGALASSESAPPKPVPAGWVVRHIGGPLRWLCRGPRGYEPYATREDAQRIADTTGGEAVPVDAAGNVIEGGVAWEAARSYEEAERLRAELATWKRTAEQRMERIRSVKAERDDRSARCDAAEADVARLTKERDTARAERDTAKAERDKLTTDEADLRYALRTIAGLVGGAVALGASTEIHCAMTNEVRLAVERLKREEALAREGERIAVAERDRLAAEVQRGREQKPVRWAVCSAVGDLEGIWFHESDARALAGARIGWTVAPLYLAPVVRDHSEVIAQCEEALHRPRTGYECERDSALRAALAALRGAP